MPLELDCSKLKIKENAEITYYRYMGGSEFKLLNIDPYNAKLEVKNGNYVTIKYFKDFMYEPKWYISSSQGIVKA